jgi:hypothetical protein
MHMIIKFFLERTVWTKIYWKLYEIIVVCKKVLIMFHKYNV